MGRICSLLQLCCYLALIRKLWIHLGYGYVGRAYNLTIHDLLNVITQISKPNKVIPYALCFQF